MLPPPSNRRMPRTMGVKVQKTPNNNKRPIASTRPVLQTFSFSSFFLLCNVKNKSAKTRQDVSVKGHWARLEEKNVVIHLFNSVSDRIPFLLRKKYPFPESFLVLPVARGIASVKQMARRLRRSQQWIKLYGAPFLFFFYFFPFFLRPLPIIMAGPYSVSTAEYQILRRRWRRKCSTSHVRRLLSCASWNVLSLLVPEEPADQ